MTTTQPASESKLPFVFDDGGRAVSGFRGQADDCVVRAVAIASGLPYADVYKDIAKGVGAERGSKGATAPRGVHTDRKWFREYMQSLGLVWVPTMRIGQGCTTRLVRGELPNGRLIAKLSKHVADVIDVVIHDTHDPSRATEVTDASGKLRLARRCVYGYWVWSANHRVTINNYHIRSIKALPRLPYMVK